MKPTQPLVQLKTYPVVVQEARTHGMARAEVSALRRSSPRRSRWPALAKLDQRVVELEQRKREVADETQRLFQERQRAPELDANELADWIAGGEKGRKPEPTLPRIEECISELVRDRDGLERAIERVLEEKVELVERHRKRLVRSADQATRELRERYEQQVDDLARTRDELADARSAAVWAATFPSEAASVTPPTPVAGGLRRLLEAAGISSQVRPDQLWTLLREDAQWLQNVTTAEQVTAMGLNRPDATWAATDEGAEAERKDRQQALDRYRALWGRDPA